MPGQILSTTNVNNLNDLGFSNNEATPAAENRANPESGA
jgi:hypothetical protein